MAAVRPIELSLTVSPVCVRLVMTMVNVNIASASLTCCGQYGIIMLGHNNGFREYDYVPIIGHFYAFLLVHGSHNHTLSQRACRRNDATSITPWSMLNSIRSHPSFVLSIKAIECRTISVNCRFGVSGVIVQYIVEQLIN